MKEFFKKIKLNTALFFNGLFRGMKSADTKMLSQIGGSEEDDQEITHRQEINSVYADLLQEKETQEVKEIIDASYRVAREADHYDVTLVGDLGDDSVDSDRKLSAVAVKKVAMKYDKHPEVFNEKTYHVTLIQENKKIQKKGNWDGHDVVEALNAPEHNFDTNLTLTYDGFTPRFKLENFVTKMVLRETKNGCKKLDLYVFTDAGQFTKTDAILIAELHKIKDKELEKTDFLDIKSAEFVTDKAYGADDLIKYIINELKYNKISIFDGSFVLTFNVGKLETFDYVEAHKTETLTKKYEEMAPKKPDLNIENFGAVERREEKMVKKTPGNQQIIDFKNNLDYIKKKLPKK